MDSSDIEYFKSDAMEERAKRELTILLRKYDYDSETDSWSLRRKRR